MAFTFVVTGIVMGLIFGFAIEKSRVFEPGMMVGLFQFRNLTVLKVFLSAIATSMVVISVLNILGLVDPGPKAAVYPATIAGGLIFGAGVALAGGCPTTLPAQIGAGYKDAWAVLAGGVFGAVIYGYFEPLLSGLNQGPGKITIPQSLGLPFWALGFPVAIIIAIFLAVLERRRPWKSEMGKDYNGDF
ncbi:YeeE/YedE thiosulfate transporter family protein [Marispirochaeta aestuarii]|uniref:YeeE/YedE thiosulfate transporter family protein n=1 Tax=Marispirochaeta aestuarii TaxID=1963862 RepID=UPI0029C79EE4|nr:YeeE/YedE thiosulfate transporter family protein [Marispirochaeta aestuarii]